MRLTAFMLLTRLTKRWPLIMGLVLYHLLVVIVVWANFPPEGHFFTGWDALHPEFNIGVNLERAVFGAWQKNYGLGTSGGHGFAALLPLTLMTGLLKLIVPLWSVRAWVTFSCFYLGGLGVYWLLRELLGGLEGEGFKEKEWLVAAASLGGAWYYLFNLGTVQQFYIQLEAFVVHFVALPENPYTKA